MTSGRKRRRATKALADVHIKPALPEFLRKQLKWVVEEGRLNQSIAKREDLVLLRHAAKNGQIFITEDGGVPDQTGQLWGRAPGIIVLPETDVEVQMTLMAATSFVIHAGLKNHPRSFENVVMWPGPDGIWVRDNDGAEKFYSWIGLNILEPFGPL